jgi:Cofactor assembly of complex C subunit B
MQTPVLSSTALLTILMSIGLVFFIRASTKDRIQVAKLVTPQQGEPLLEQIQQYFTQRAYRIATVDAAKNQVTYEGFVRPSVFLAVFLTLLAAIGLLCLALMLSFSFPDATSLLPGLVIFAPLAGIFYWKKSARPEQVLLQVEALSDSNQPSSAQQSLLTVTAHRDELAELQRSLNLTPLETD